MNINIFTVFVLVLMCVLSSGKQYFAKKKFSLFFFQISNKKIRGAKFRKATNHQHYWSAVAYGRLYKQLRRKYLKNSVS